MTEYLSGNVAPLSNQEGWTFVGVPKWKQDQEGHIYPPVWSYPNFDPDPSAVPNAYAHELAREDYAFLTSELLGDTDVSVDYKCPYGSVIHGGIVFRAVDSARCYVLEINDMGRKGHHYELVLWLQDGAGYRKELARGRAPHSIVPERIVQTGPKSRADWHVSSPDWVTARVQASGSYIRVSMDGDIVFETRDRTYSPGCVGLVARGAVYFRNLRVSGERAELPAPWTTHEGELPRFFYPGGQQPEGFNAYPVVCSTRSGAVLVAWGHSPAARKPRHCQMIMFTRSDDLCRTWSPIRCIYDGGERICNSASLFEHKGGTISCLVRAWPRGDEQLLTALIFSKDGGQTWSEPSQFRVGGRLPTPTEGPYSPMQRLSDGSVVMCGYDAQVVPGGDAGCNADRIDRSIFLRSSDDGFTWGAPIYFDPDNFDHNECMVAEVSPGKLVAFMRTLAAPCMWTSRSEDYGQSWTPLVQSDITGECPQLLRHSSGTLIMTSRGCGVFAKLSYDGGKTWTKECRISPASAMVGMTELPDGRVFIAMHEGYRVPGNIRGEFFRVTAEGPEPAE